MTREEMIERLRAHGSFGVLPRAELQWIAEHGTYRLYPAGGVPRGKGEYIDEMIILLSGRLSIHVGERAGWRRVVEWRAGELSGKLPYSRMGSSPGDTVADEEVEAIVIHERLFPEMIRECPQLTASAVHSMLDRARTFNTAYLQDEKMLSLGRVAAGLAHELNNPASAAVRGAQLLAGGLREAEDASRELGGLGLGEAQIARVERMRESCLEPRANGSRSPLEQADRLDEIGEWLEAHGLSADLAEALGETTITAAALDSVAESLDSRELDAVLRWFAAGCNTRTLARDIERSASRIAQLVSSIKRFTYMDRAQVPEPVDVGQALGDTMIVLGSKARHKSVALKLEVAPDLPKIPGFGGELNQVWMNLIDNALDAAPAGTAVEISVRLEHGFLVVRVVDSGPGIPEEIRQKIFDPFFSTKPPGEGTGLGLDIVQRVVRRHRGELEVSSRPGRTEFRVGLPLDGAE